MILCLGQYAKEREFLLGLMSPQHWWMSFSSESLRVTGYIITWGEGANGSRQIIMKNLANRRSFKTALATSVTISLYRTLLRIFSHERLELKNLSPGFLAGALAGLAIAIHPADSRRVTIAIYFLTRALEFCYNFLDDKGFLPRKKPWWFGSWLIFPLSSAQLLHAFVFDRDCFPQARS